MKTHTHEWQYSYWLDVTICIRCGASQCGYHDYTPAERRAIWTRVAEWITRAIGRAGSLTVTR